MSRDFFHESVSPQPQSIQLGPFQIFRKFLEIFARQGAPPVSTTPEANFATIFASVVETGGKFATGVNDEMAVIVPTLRCLGETDSWKKPEVENLVALSL